MINFFFLINQILKHIIIKSNKKFCIIYDNKSIIIIIINTF